MQNHNDPSALPPPESGWSGVRLAVLVVTAMVLGAVMSVGALVMVGVVALSQTADADAGRPGLRTSAPSSSGATSSGRAPAASSASEKLVTGSVVVHDGAFKSAGCQGAGQGVGLRDGGLVELLDEQGRQLGTARMRRDARDVESDWCMYKFSMPKVPTDRTTYRFRIAGLGETPLPRSEMQGMGWFVWLDVGRVPTSGARL